MDTVSTPAKYLNYVENTIGPFLNEINFALFELIQGEGGINIANKKMVQTLVAYLRANGVWIIVDEVQSGLGRTGQMWASDLYEIEPDIITVAKALSGGIVPIGATILREDLSYRQPKEHSNTFGGLPQACAAGLKVLEIIQRESLANESEYKGMLLRANLQTAAKSNAASVSGRGLMSRITFQNSETRDAVIRESLNLGLFLMGAGERSIRLMPPLTIADQDLKKAVEILTEAVRKTHSQA